jgi:thiamine-monophosphate kinase
VEPPQPDPNLGERRLIGRLLAPRAAAPPWLTLDAGHDCAVVDGDLALTADTLVEGVHFDQKLSAEDVGYKTVAVSVSDLAAVRAQPRWMVLALSLPAGPRLEGWSEGFARGLHSACEAYGVHLVGGDTTRVPPGAPIFVSATLGGRCLAAPRARSGARPGDTLWVTGWPGLASVGWMLEHPPEASLAALRRPRPPLSFALALDLATAAMDLSDGLASDLPRLCEASGVGVTLFEEQVPVHPALSTSPVRRQAILAGGDDYELLFTAPPEAEGQIRELALQYGAMVSPIGRVTLERGARLADGPWPSPAFAHFEGGAA